MNDVIGQILPFAVAVSVSPVQIIAVILLLFSDRPTANAGALVAGFVAGLAGVLAALVVAASALDLSAGSDGSSGVAWGRIALGLLLLVAAVRRFRGRPGPDDEPHLPKWMDGIRSFSPGKSFGAGLALGAVNPKMLAMALAASAVIATADLPVGGEVVAVVVYVAIGTIGVAAPLVVTLAVGERSRPVLEDWRTWLERNNAAVMSVLFLVFGAILLGQGLQTI